MKEVLTFAIAILALTLAFLSSFFFFVLFLFPTTLIHWGDWSTALFLSLTSTAIIGGFAAALVYLGNKKFLIRLASLSWLLLDWARNTDDCYGVATSEQASIVS